MDRSWVSKFEPYLGSLKMPATFSQEWDSGRRMSLRGTGHLLLFIGIVGLATGYTRVALVVAIITGLLAILRGYMPPKSSDEWAAPDPEMDEALEHESVLVRGYAHAAPYFGIATILIFGGSLALWLTDPKMFVVGLVGMLVSVAAFLMLLRQE